jgi:hypothetical protein
MTMFPASVVSYDTQEGCTEALFSRDMSNVSLPPRNVRQKYMYHCHSEVFTKYLLSYTETVDSIIRGAVFC